MAEAQDSGIPRGTLTRRDFFKKALVRPAIGLVMSRFPEIKIADNHSLPDRTLAIEEDGPIGERLFLKDYLIQVVDAEGYYGIDYARLSLEQPEFVTYESSQQFEGFVFKNSNKNPKILDLSGLEGKTIIAQGSTVKRAAITNVDVNLYRQGPNDTPQSVERGYGELTAGMVFIGDFVMETLDGNRPVITCFKQGVRQADVAIYATSREPEHRIATVAVKGIEISGVPFSKQDENGSWWCPAPAGISADNCSIELTDCIIDASLQSDPEFVSAFKTQELEAWQTDILTSIKTLPIDNDYIGAVYRTIESQYTSDLVDLERRIDPHDVQHQLARGVVMNNTGVSSEVPHFTMISCTTISPWDGITISSACNCYIDHSRIIQDPYVLQHMTAGAAVGAVRSDISSLVVNNSVAIANKGIWRQGGNSSSSAIQLSHVKISSDQWSIRNPEPAATINNAQFRPKKGTGERATRTGDLVRIDNAVGLLSLSRSPVNTSEMLFTIPSQPENALIVLIAQEVEGDVEQNNVLRAQQVNERLGFLTFVTEIEHPDGFREISNAYYWFEGFKTIVDSFPEPYDKVFVVLDTNTKQVGLVFHTFTSDQDKQDTIYWV